MAYTKNKNRCNGIFQVFYGSLLTELPGFMNWSRQLRSLPLMPLESTDSCLSKEISRIDKKSRNVLRAIHKYTHKAQLKLDYLHSLLHQYETSCSKMQNFHLKRL